jgi:hypothetical protein
LGLMHQQGDMLLGLIWEEELAAFQVWVKGEISFKTELEVFVFNHATGVTGMARDP